MATLESALGPAPTNSAAFTAGSIMRHVLVMSSTGAIGLISVFAVDFLSLLYVSWLRDPVLVAGIGYASQVLFAMTSVAIGFAIAVTALVSRDIGGGADPRPLAGSCLVHTAVWTAVVAVGVFIWRGSLLDLLGASGRTWEVASRFLAITVPAHALLALGMSLSGILRAASDARRAMYVTLFGAVASAILDPILIFGFGLGVDGAAISTVCSRIVFVATGFWGTTFVHRLVAWPGWRRVGQDTVALLAIAGPAILTNLAAPVGNGYALRIFSAFGETTVAAFVIIDRITPVAFGVLFALTGSVGPIIGQNVGAGLWLRVRQTLLDCFLLSGGYALIVWLLLWAFAPQIADLFGAVGRTRELVIFFCSAGATIWLFLGCLFIANAAFNNLGFPLLATTFNWGRATLGTIPFVTLGTRLGGAEGGYTGIIVGAAAFGLAAMVTAFLLTSRLARRRSAQSSVQDPTLRQRAAID